MTLTPTPAQFAHISDHQHLPGSIGAKLSHQLGCSHVGIAALVHGEASTQ